MRDYLDEWLARKRDRPQLSIREARSARFKFARALGLRGQYAVIHLRAEPAIAFRFSSVAKWPSPKCDYSIAVLDVEVGGSPRRAREVAMKLIERFPCLDRNPAVP